MKSFKFLSSLFLIIFVFFISIYGQQKDRLISSSVYPFREPIKIVRMKVKDKPVNSGKYFAGDDDWLKDLSVEVENITNLTISYLEIELDFPNEQNNTFGPTPAVTLSYGAFPPLPGKTALKQKKSPPPLKPGERTTLRLSPDILQTLLDNAGYQRSIVEVNAKSGRVIFPNETMWYKGGIFRRDINDPRSWRNMKSIKPAN